MLAIDPGSRRVGLAVTDELQITAQPLRSIAAEPRSTLAARLSEVASEVGASEVVVGLPRRLDGSQGPEALDARKLADEVRAATRLPVALVDERLTSKQAERGLAEAGVRGARRRESVDALAATLILQTYLARRRGR